MGKPSWRAHSHVHRWPFWRPASCACCHWPGVSTVYLLFMHSMLMMQHLRLPLHANPAYHSTTSMTAFVSLHANSNIALRRQLERCVTFCAKCLHSAPHAAQMRPQNSPSTKAANSSVMICMPLRLLELSPPPSPPQSPPDTLPEPPSPPLLSVSWSAPGRHLAEGLASQPESLSEPRAGTWNAACTSWVCQVAIQCSKHAHSR